MDEHDRITLRQAGRVVRWSPAADIPPRRWGRLTTAAGSPWPRRCGWILAAAIPLAAAVIVAFTVDHGQ